jgi:hypothetical protein
LLAAYERLGDAEGASATKACLDGHRTAAGQFSTGDLLQQLTELRRDLLRFSKMDFGRGR